MSFSDRPGFVDKSAKIVVTHPKRIMMLILALLIVILVLIISNMRSGFRQLGPFTHMKNGFGTSEVKGLRTAYGEDNKFLPTSDMDELSMGMPSQQ